MKRIRKIFVSVFFLLSMVGAFSFREEMTLRPAAAESEETKVKSGLVQEDGSYYYYSNGKKLKSSWKTIKGKKYYFKSNGKAATGGYKIKGTVYVFSSKGVLKTGSKTRFVTVGKYKYRVSKKGVAKTGWFVTGGKLYYALKSNGRLSSKTRSKITFNKKTYAAKTKGDNNAKLKYYTVKIVNNITNSNMKKSQKLKACWDYVVKKSRFTYVRSYSFSFKKGWAKTAALQWLKYRNGNCRDCACAFAALAYEIGYDPYVVWGYVPASAGGQTRHAWVTINGKYYDPEGQFAGWNPGVYGASSYCGTRTNRYRYKNL